MSSCLLHTVSLWSLASQRSRQGWSREWLVATSERPWASFARLSCSRNQADDDHEVGKIGQQYWGTLSLWGRSTKPCLCGSTQVRAHWNPHTHDWWCNFCTYFRNAGLKTKLHKKYFVRFVVGVVTVLWDFEGKKRWSTNINFAQRIWFLCPKGRASFYFLVILFLSLLNLLLVWTDGIVDSKLTRMLLKIIKLI